MEHALFYHVGVGELQFIQECFDMDEDILIPSILQSW
jgi:hypothetical protein